MHLCFKLPPVSPSTAQPLHPRIACRPVLCKHSVRFCCCMRPALCGMACRPVLCKRGCQPSSPARPPSRKTGRGSPDESRSMERSCPRLHRPLQPPRHPGPAEAARVARQRRGATICMPLIAGPTRFTRAPSPWKQRPSSLSRGRRPPLRRRWALPGLLPPEPALSTLGLTKTEVAERPGSGARSGPRFCTRKKEMTNQKPEETA